MSEHLIVLTRVVRCAAASIGGGLLVASALAQAPANEARIEAQVFPSNAPGALERPDNWDCDYLVDEWNAWRAEGRDWNDWRFASRLYRDVEDDDLYSWRDWLDWYDTSGCPSAVAFDEAGQAIGTATLAGAEASGTGLSSNAAIIYGIGGAIGALGIVVVASRDDQTDSPG